MQRLPRLTKAELDVEQLTLHRLITSGSRTSGPQLVELQDAHGARTLRTRTDRTGRRAHRDGVGR
jgi:hypothetical protein